MGGRLAPVVDPDSEAGHPVAPFLGERALHNDAVGALTGEVDVGEFGRRYHGISLFRGCVDTAKATRGEASAHDPTGYRSGYREGEVRL